MLKEVVMSVTTLELRPRGYNTITDVAYLVSCLIDITIEYDTIRLI
jgi:hypothetical protein